MIQLENVTFTYNGSEEKGNLKNINLSIREGTEKHIIFILTLIKKKKSIRVFMILVDFLLDKI